MEISSEAPALYYGHEIDWRGSRESKTIWIGSTLPETFVSSATVNGKVYPHAQAFGWTREEAKRKLEQALAEVN